MVALGDEIFGGTMSRGGRESSESSFLGLGWNLGSNHTDY